MSLTGYGLTRVKSVFRRTTATSRNVPFSFLRRVPVNPVLDVVYLVVQLNYMREQREPPVIFVHWWSRWNIRVDDRTLSLWDEISDEDSRQNLVFVETKVDQRNDVVDRSVDVHDVNRLLGKDLTGSRLPVVSFFCNKE